MVGGTAACKESIRELGHQWRTCECRRVYGHREGNLKSSTELASPLAAGVSIVGPGAGPPQSQREQPPLAKKEEEELTGSGSFSFQGKKAQELTLTVGKGGRIASSALFSSDGPGRTSLWAGLF